MTFSLPVALGAWMLYLILGILAGRIPEWARPGTLRYTVAWAALGAIGLARTVSTNEIGYVVAGFVAAVMVYALLNKRDEDA